jgi:molecular chaperone GrpE
MPDLENQEQPETSATAETPGTVTLEELEALKKELAEAQARAQENLDGWQRTLADFSNYKKRTERENEGVYQIARGTVIKRYLVIIDDLERALANRPADDAWTNGIDLIYRKLQAILETEGVTRMDAEGQLFDPNFHEAIMQEESPDQPSGTVLAVLQQGYLIGDKVLRPAVVKVAA